MSQSAGWPIHPAEARSTAEDVALVFLRDGRQARRLAEARRRLASPGDRTATSTARVASTRPLAMTKGSRSGTESARAATDSTTNLSAGAMLRILRPVL